MAAIESELVPKQKRQPLQEISSDLNEDKTVLDSMKQLAEALMTDLEETASLACDELRREFESKIIELRAQMQLTTKANEPECYPVITLSSTAGPHRGEVFTLSAQGGAEHTFKIGRSTGRLFKTKGVSLKLDKEVSTTHAKIETRGTLAFLTDLQSTNGTSVNNEDIEPDEAVELKDGDVICVGKTQLAVTIVYVPLGGGNTHNNEATR